MAFYVLLVIVLASLIIVADKFSRAETFIGIMLLAILVFLGGFRDGIGIDYKSYVDWYINGTRDNDFEIGFLFLMRLFRYFNLSYHFLFFFFNLFFSLFSNPKIYFKSSVSNGFIYLNS